MNIWHGFVRTLAPAYALTIAFATNAEPQAGDRAKIMYFHWDSQFDGANDKFNIVFVCRDGQGRNFKIKSSTESRRDLQTRTSNLHDMRVAVITLLSFYNPGYRAELNLDCPPANFNPIEWWLSIRPAVCRLYERHPDWLPSPWTRTSCPVVVKAPESSAIAR